jgi:hypothetical protein
VLLVASAKHARRSVLAEVRRLLAACPARKLGLVVTGVESRDVWGDADAAFADTLLLDGVEPAVRVRPDRSRVPGGVS